MCITVFTINRKFQYITHPLWKTKSKQKFNWAEGQILLLNDTSCTSHTMSQNPSCSYQRSCHEQTKEIVIIEFHTWVVKAQFHFCYCAKLKWVSQVLKLLCRRGLNSENQNNLRRVICTKKHMYLHLWYFYYSDINAMSWWRSSVYKHIHVSVICQCFMCLV